MITNTEHHTLRYTLLGPNGGEREDTFEFQVTVDDEANEVTNDGAELAEERLMQRAADIEGAGGVIRKIIIR